MRKLKNEKKMTFIYKIGKRQLKCLRYITSIDNWENTTLLLDILKTGGVQKKTASERDCKTINIAKSYEG